jgi:hypothetical protein
VVVFERKCLDLPLTCRAARRVVAELAPNGWNGLDWAAQDRLVILEQDRQRFLVYQVSQKLLSRTIPLPGQAGVANFAVALDGAQIYFSQRAPDDKGAAIYQASLADGKIDRLYYGAGEMEIWVQYVVEKE